MKTILLDSKIIWKALLILSCHFSFAQLTLIDVAPGPSSSFATDLEAVATATFFSAADIGGDVEPHIFDPATSPTAIKIDVNTIGSSFPASFTEVGGDKMFFTAEDETGDRELYVIDSSGVLTKIDVDPAGSSDPTWLTNILGTLFFTATVAGDKEAFFYDGFAVTKIDTNPAGSGDPEEYTFAGGFTFFAATDAGDKELYKFDGLTLTKIDVNPSGSSDPNELVAVGSNLFFNAESTTGDKELHEYDTAMSSTTEIDVSATGSSSPFALYTAEGPIADGILYFTASDLGDVEMYQYNPFTTTLTKIDIDPVGSSFPAIFPGNYLKVGTSIFVPAEIESTGDRELYEYDIMSGMTTKIDVNPAGPSAPLELTEMGGALYFTADDPSAGKELYKYDGSLTKIELNPTGSGEPGMLTVVAGTALTMAGTDGMTGFELFEWIDMTLSIDDFAATNNLKMYPNPINSDDFLTLKFSNIVQITEVKIYNINGSLIDIIVSENNDNLLEIPVRNLISGIYLIHITSTSGNHVRKLIRN